MSARVRAHDVLDIALGTVVTDPSTTLWVFCGWAEVTAGKSAVFVRSMDGRRIGPAFTWSYNAVYMDTLLMKFPDLGRFVRAS